MDPAPASSGRQKRSARRIALRVVADAVAISTALFGASIVRFEIMAGAPAQGIDYTVLTLIATPVWLITFWMYGLYEPRQVLGPVQEFKQVFHSVVAGSVLIFMADSIFKLDLARGWALIAMASGFFVVGLERLLVRKTLHFLRRRGGDPTRALIIGANAEAKTVARMLEREAWLGYRILGFVDDDIPVGQEVSDGHEVLGPISELRDLITRHRATLVLIAATSLDANRINRLLWDLNDVEIDLQVTSGTVDVTASRMIVQSVAGVPLLYVRRTGMNRLQRLMKRSLDVGGSAFGLLLLSPFLAAIALWIKRDSDGPAFFTQVRVGRDGEVFTCYKFRTMVPDAEERLAELEHLSEGPGILFKIKDDPRVTKAGRFLRRYSLDELPQLWNVLRGEMSMVGPRPPIPSEVEQYDEWVRNRLRVKPGLTGLWQVSGRTETSFSDYVRYDLFYIQNWSFSLDLWIIWRTVRAVLSAEGAH